MANAKTATQPAAATTTPEQTAALQTTDNAMPFSMTVPDYLKDDDSREGLETFSRDDVSIPRLVLAQALTPQVTKGDPRRIEGLEPGHLFNSMTGQNYGEQVYVQIVKKEPLRAMEFYPQDDGGGVKDPNVPLNDPRCKWGADGEKPVATVFRDYIARILPSGEMIALSFKSSGIEAAKALNGLILMRRKPIYTGAYVIKVGHRLDPKPHFVFMPDNAGYVDEKTAMEGKALYDAVKDLNTHEQVDRGDSGADDFDYGSNRNGGRQPGDDDEM